MPVRIGGSGGGDGLLYSPAETGFDATVLPAGGAIINGSTIALAEVFRFKSASIIREQAAGGGTPMTVFFQSIGSRNVQWSDGLINSGLWTGLTNNPRTQWALFAYAVGNATFAGTTGVSVVGEVAKLFASPWGRFAAQNNDGAVAITLSLTLILWK